MTAYLVKWEIDIDAESSEEAAQEALRIQRDPRSVATVFQVRDAERLITHEIDLNPES